MSVTGTLACVAAGNAGLQVVDVLDPTRPHIIGSLDTPSYAFGVEVRDSIAYVADGTSSGLRVISIADPTVPVELGSFQTASCAYGLDVRGSIAYVADQYDGLRLVDVTDPARPFEAGYYDTGGYVDGVAIGDSLIFAADHWNGLHIMKSLYSATDDALSPQSASRREPTTIVRGSLLHTGSPGELLDIRGRRVKELCAGDIDLRELTPGVYFLRTAESRGPETQRLVLVR